MKILGLTNSTGYSSDGGYICEIKHTELEQFLDLYYGKMKTLKVGDVVDMSVGLKFYHETKESIKITGDFIKANSKIIDAIMRGFVVIDGDQSNENVSN